ncbi:MAG: AAA family ATPase, partial [Spirochaetota bacterium]|nr:AAA family ATPase [Spirochaetota bacterium]
MTRKTNLLFICNECSYETTKWLGRCPQCEAWNSFSELTKSKSLSKKTLTHKIQSLSDVPYAPEKKYKTGISEFDTVLGGGIVPGSLILLGGEPGIGKSTFLLQICDKLSQYGPILYNNGEESSQQIKLRSKRLKINEENIFLLDETDLGAIESSISQIKPIGIIIDSIQTVYRQDVLGLPGNISQVKEAANLFLNISKKENIFIFLVSHVTKEGNIAGPKALEHTVDVVLYIEGKKHNSFRILRNYKNRFGTTDEIGVFQMTEFGIHEVTNPSEHFIQDYNYSFSGTTLS